jgi:hypothetical protein
VYSTATEREVEVCQTSSMEERRGEDHHSAAASTAPE